MSIFLLEKNTHKKTFARSPHQLPLTSHWPGSVHMPVPKLDIGKGGMTPPQSDLDS